MMGKRWFVFYVFLCFLVSCNPMLGDQDDLATKYTEATNPSTDNGEDALLIQMFDDQAIYAGECFDLLITNTTSECIVFPPDYGVRLYIYSAELG